MHVQGTRGRLGRCKVGRVVGGGLKGGRGQDEGALQAMVSTDACVGTRGAGASRWEDLYCVPHSLLPRAAQASGSPSLLKHHEGSRDTQSTEERKWGFTRLPLHPRRDAATILRLIPVFSLARLPGARPGKCTHLD